jgi:DNA-binding SARP family transcriptional activator
VSGLEVKLFGEVSIRQSGRLIPQPKGKPFELLCYLVIHRERAHNRELLSDFLWPDETTIVAKRYFRQALWKLNTALQQAATTGRSTEYLTTQRPGWIGVNPEAEISADVSDFDQAYVANRETRGPRLTDSQAGQLDAAVHLYRGDLLLGFPQEWCIQERARVQQAYLTMLEQLMGYCETHQFCERGLKYGALALDQDAALETAHRHLMRLHYQAGNRTAAIQQYHRCVDALSDELDVGPSIATVDLYQQICTERTGGEPPNDAAPDPRAATGHDRDALAEVHARLDQIQATLQVLLGMMAPTWGAGGISGSVPSPAPHNQSDVA